MASPYITKVQNALAKNEHPREHAAMQRPNISNHGTALLLQPSVPSLDSLTGRSRGRPVTGFRFGNSERRAP